MNKQSFLVAGMAFLGGATATMIGIRVQGARAEVPGVAERLSYSGVLLQGTASVTGSRTIRVRFFDAPVSGNVLPCTPPDTVVDLTKTAGHFHVNVSDCVEELEVAPNAFVEVTLDPNGTNQSFPPSGTPRPRIGAVPYAGQALRVPFAGVDGLTASTPWPGTIPTTRVTSGTGTAEQRLADLESGATVGSGLVASAAVQTFDFIPANPSIPAAPFTGVGTLVLTTTNALVYTPRFPSSRLSISVTATLGWNFTNTVAGSVEALLRVKANGVPFARGSLTAFSNSTSNDSGGAIVTAEGFVDVPATSPPAPITLSLELEKTGSASAFSQISCPRQNDAVPQCQLRILEIRN